MRRSALTRPSRRIAACAIAGGLLLAACGDDDDEGSEVTTAQTQAPAAPSAPAESPTSEPMNDDQMSEEGMNGAMGSAFGPACSAVPSSGEGSFSGMSDDPAATAASNNPVLSTLVTAVGQAGLVDTLNGEGPFTIFAPTNDAFAAVPEADLQALLADNTALTGVLTYHVIAGEKLSVEDLVEQGSATTVNGAELTFTEGADGAVVVNGSSNGVCMDVPTANATVHIIDSVLLPSA